MTHKEKVALSIISSRMEHIRDNKDNDGIVDWLAAQCKKIADGLLARDPEFIGNFKDQKERDELWDKWSHL